jgi:hypothetical protein
MGRMKSDQNKLPITLSMITFNGFHILQLFIILQQNFQNILQLGNVIHFEREVCFVVGCSINQ